MQRHVFHGANWRAQLRFSDGILPEPTSVPYQYINSYHGILVIVEVLPQSANKSTPFWRGNTHYVGSDLVEAMKIVQRYVGSQTCPDRIVKKWEAARDEYGANGVSISKWQEERKRAGLRPGTVSQ